MKKLAFPLAMIAAWQVWAAISHHIDVSPLDIANVLARDIGSGRLPLDSGATLRRLLLGTALGAVSGILVGYALAFSRVLHWFIGPTLLFLAQFPPIVWTPLVIATAGIGDAAKVELVALAAFFVWFPAQMRSIEEIEPALTEVLHAYNLPTWRAVQYFYFPATLPSLAHALRLSIVFGWVILIAAELIGASDGLGWYVWDARNFGRNAEFLAGLLVIGLIGSLLTLAVDLIGRRLTPWRPEMERL